MAWYGIVQNTLQDEDQDFLNRFYNSKFLRMPCDRSTNRKHRRPAKNKVKLTSLQCQMASDIRAERQNSNVGQRPTYERKGLKAEVFKHRARNLQDLKQAIREEVLCIPQAMLERVHDSFRIRLQQCIDNHGHHLSDILFKRK
ncbi:hypothetical protein J6590_072442 [Homalodisca vitripennis]|nr:hypothetical protein J6590_072442 [Homalodisca vitripennis]